MQEIGWLDDINRFREMDPSDMLSKVERFPRMLQEAYEIGSDLDPSRFGEIRQVILFGMGGSAVGGDFLRCCAYDLAQIPVSVVRGYTVPNSVNSNTLAIICSYSGNTEESLSCYEQAMQKNAKILCITSGGKVEQIAQKHGHALLKIPGGLPPRSALGYSFGPLLKVFERLNLIPCQKDALNEAVAALDDCVKRYAGSVPTEQNEAKLLAWNLFERLPVVCSSSPEFEAVVIRWKGQLSENSKVLSIGHLVPEMNHNEIVGWSGLKQLAQQMHVVMLRDEKEHPQNKKRFNATTQLLREASANISEHYSKGDGLLARIFSFVSLGDFVSVYLAILNREDPTPVKSIDFLKDYISK